MRVSTDEFRVANQLILENYLKGDLKDGVAFTMAMFSRTSNYSEDCGTAGCAVGHAPYAGIKKFHTEDWREYARRALWTTPDEYLWLFAGYWYASRYPTAKDVAERLEVVRVMRDQGLEFRAACAALGEHAVAQADEYEDR